MKVQELMTSNPAFCTPDSDMQTVARMMCERNCGEIPVVEEKQSMKPIGVITDRDITCRAVAQGKNPLDLTVRDCMTSPAVTVTPEMMVEDCVRVLQDRQIRRVPVVDKGGRLIGIVAQADIARKASPDHTAKVVREVSQVH